MESLVKLLFYPKNQKTNKGGKTPIYLKITYSHYLPAELSTGIYIQEGQWNSELKRIIGDPSISEDQNDEMSVIRQKIKKIIKDNWNNGQITPQQIKALFLCEEDKESTVPLLDLVDLYKKFIKEQESRVGETLAPSTINIYNQHLEKLIDFLKSIKKPNILPINFSPKIALEFRKYIINKSWGKGKKNPSINHATVTLQYVNRVLDFGVTIEAIPYNPISSLNLIVKPKIDRTCLDSEEFQKWVNYVPKCELSLKSKLLYIISSYTGLAYIDTQAFDKSKHLIKRNNTLCIQLLRHKNRFRKDRPDTFVPLSHSAITILQELNFELPKIPRSTYDKYLKLIGKEIGFTKKISSHKARKGFGDHLINELGVPIEIASLQLGHSNIEITHRMYARPNEKKILDTMNNIQNAA